METQFWQYHSKLHAFQLFSAVHLITLGVIFCLCLLLFVGRKGFHDPSKRNFFRYFFAVLLFLSFTFQQLWFVQQQAWTLKVSLPIQLSDLVVLIAILMLITKGVKLFQFMYFAGISSSIQALLTPDLGRYSFPHFQYLEFFIFHGGTLIACLFMLWAYPYKPTLRSLWISGLIINVYAAMVFFLNKKLKANYLYIMKKPSAHSLLNLLGPWPWYLLMMDLVMFFTFYLLYSPFWIKQRLNQKEQLF